MLPHLSVSMKSKNGKILDVGCNITAFYSNYITYHNPKIVPFLEVLEGLNAVLARFTDPQTPSCILDTISTEKR